jgi:hypothetical protein
MGQRRSGVGITGLSSSATTLASSDPRAGVCLMTAEADRALAVTSGTESCAACVPVVGDIMIGSRWRAPPL